MGHYIARRLLFMIPTLLGITFLVFMLVALSPGGVGATRLAGGGASSSSAVREQAYLEDRYGLDEPAIVQYLRWLRQISPIKFGAPAQITPGGERVSQPRAPRPPPLMDWWGDASPRAAGPPPDAAADASGGLASAPQEEKIAAYRAAAREYAGRRGDMVVANAALRHALRRYAEAVGLEDAFDADSRPHEAVFRRHEPRSARPEWAEVVAAGQTATEAYRRALEARERVGAALAAKPYPEAGLPIIPGFVSLAPPDFGVSFVNNRPVLEIIGRALPVTLLLNLIAFPVIYLVAIPTGMLAAARRGSWFDVASGAFFVALWSIPTVWAGVLALGFLASPQQGLGWFPVSGLHDRAADHFLFLPSFRDGVFQRGYLLDLLWHICLPVACLVYGGFAILAKQTRAAMLENLSADYVRTAIAKGVPRRAVLLRHVFRNSLLPLITMFVGLFPAILSGSVVVETIFAVPGMGKAMIDAIANRDRELILANTVMIAVVNLLALLLADILYALADPRVTYD